MRVLCAQRDPHRNMGLFVHDGRRCRCPHRYCGFCLHIVLYLPALFAAAVGVVAVAIKTKSMLWCCVSGIGLYIVLSLVWEWGAFTVRAPRIEFLTEPVCFFWYHVQTLL